jgi:ribosome-associated protein
MLVVRGERAKLQVASLTPLEWIGRAVRAAADKKAKDIAVIDVGAFLAITDHFLICSAPSDRQVRTIAEEIERVLTIEKRKPIRREGSPEGGWILLDYGDFVVHVFSDEMRAYYDLERLWKDAPRPELPELVEAREALG